MLQVIVSFIVGVGFGFFGCIATANAISKKYEKSNIEYKEKLQESKLF